jgi:hypothetical protein
MFSKKISETEQVVITRSDGQTIGRYQEKKEGKWVNKVCRVYPGDHKGNIVDELQAAFQQQKAQDQAYFESKLEPYH